MGDTYYDEAARKAAVAKAERWTELQAARLDTSPEVILAAVQRSWLLAALPDFCPRTGLRW